MKDIFAVNYYYPNGENKINYVTDLQKVHEIFRFWRNAYVENEGAITVPRILVSFGTMEDGKFLYEEELFFWELGNLYFR